MEKAYDRISWSIIFQVMAKFGFSSVWINLIKTCISNCWFSVLVNGQSVGFFKIQRGIRQGDPLSPLIFVIAADYLSRSIDQMFAKNPLMYYKIKKNVKITHLAYADDILIFVNASKRSLHIYNKCIHHYENVSGQKVNIHKSNFIMYKPTPQIVNWVQRILGYNKADLPINYLGIPLWKGFQNFDMYAGVISKIQNKILSWNHHMLSTGGRLELINLVLNSIAFYSLQVLKPPGNVITFLERFFNKFLWGSNDNKMKLHWAAWNRLCFPFEEGGIGCRDINDIIKAAEIKLWWRFRTMDNIWSQLLNKKYCSRLHPMVIKCSPKSSHIWKNLCDIRFIANDKIFWNSNNGNISLWHDKWCELGPLSNFKQTKSKDSINCVWNNGEWDRRKIDRLLPYGLSDHICSYPTTPLANEPSWILSANGNFSFKTAWDLIRKKKPVHNILRQCWNAFIKPTISLFMVRLVNKWIPTPDGLLRRGIYATNFCYCCNDDENIPHLFIHGNDKRVDNIPFTAKRVCERIWNYIDTFNHKVYFKNKIFWKGAAHRAGAKPAPRPFFRCCPVRWIRPQAGWWKLNTDGEARGNPGEAAAGGIIRDHQGMPLITFSEFHGERTNNFAELYAIWRGLEYCVDQRFVKVWVETDSKIALHLIEQSSSSHWQTKAIISKIRAFCDSIEIRFSHIFREGNAVADWLANQGCDQKNFTLHDISCISGKPLGLIKLDKMCYPYIRSKKFSMPTN
ncbi:hypothetical protein OROMI_014681 [Orobanche minor]